VFREFSSEYCHNVWYRKTRTVWTVEKFDDTLQVLTQYTYANVTDGWTDKPTDTVQ